jgi:cytochrome c553
VPLPWSLPAACIQVSYRQFTGDYYNQFCGACHGAAAQGNTGLNSPRLSGSDDWYLLEQLKAFRAGSRGAHPKDRTGKQMRAMAGLLPDDKTVQDVVVFIRTVGR